ncbi:MAG: PGF-CTERM sorting domain-containing protein, partial [ANME-2 cluster archaeon]|nr:PGF-CTERM sorting domain-containing protein [ANME-2 cluster archaeon]
MAPDYVQWHGFYEMLQDRVEIEEMAEQIRGKDGSGKSDTPGFGIVLAAAGLLGVLVVMGRRRD